MNRFFYMMVVGCGVLLVACASLSDKEEASRQVSGAWQESYRQISGKKMILKTRYNPSPCDDHLKYEVELYGQFRHVQLTGDEKTLSDLAEISRSKPSNDVFDYPYLLTSDVYTSSCGQQHYVLKVSEN